MRVTSLVAVVASHTGRIWKKPPPCFERGQHLLQNGILNFVFRLSQSSRITLES